MLRAIFLILLLPRLASATTIKGTLKAYSHKSIIISTTNDFVTYRFTKAFERKIDNSGSFSITFPASKLTQIRVSVDNSSVSFWAINESIVLIKQKEDKLEIAESKGDINNLTDSMENSLHAWYPMWIDTATKDFTTAADYRKVFSIADSTEAGFLKSNIAFSELIKFFFARRKMMYVATTFSSINPDSAQNLMNAFQENYLENKPVLLNNPFYINFLEDYLNYRVSLISFKRTNLQRNPLDRILNECNYFKKDSLRKFSQIVAINFLCKGRDTGTDSTEKLTFNKEVRLSEQKIKIPGYQSYIKNINFINNQNRTGAKFPIINLKNQDGIFANIDTITTKYILVDFWATWCFPCIEEMKKFPDILQKYNKSLSIVSVSVDSDISKMINFLKKNNYYGKWITLYNGEKGNYLDIIKIGGYPTFFILDSEKRIVEIPRFNNAISYLENALKTE